MSSLQRRRIDAVEYDAPVRTLIVDDDSDYRMYLAALARRVGLYAQTAADGVDAFSRLNVSEFDLLLCDYEMPRWNGLDLIAAVRGSDRIKNVYAVMLTGHEETALKIEALSAGFDDFLQKNCTELELLAKVAAAQRMLIRQRALDVAVREWKDIATRDELTGVFTRRFFFEEASRHLAAGRSVGIVLLDLDDFKIVNDTYGHLAGDRILRDVGALFLSHTRHGDVIARFGGDEFVLLVLNVTVDDTHIVAGRMCEAIQNMSWTVGDTTIRIRATTGVGYSDLLPGENADRILEAADRHLYANKWLRKHPPANGDEIYQYERPKEAEVVPISGDDLRAPDVERDETGKA